MEIIIGALLLGLVGLVAMIFKTSTDEVKKEKAVDDAKGRRIADLESQFLAKDGELKKMMEERQRLEDEFFKAKDDAEIFKRENVDLAQKVKQLDKNRDEMAALKDEAKQKDLLAQQETIARQKMEGELALRESEIEKKDKEVAALKSELKAKTEMFDGLKGQFAELESELQKVRMEQMQKPKPEVAPKAEPPKAEPPKAEPPKAEPPLKTEPLKTEEPDETGTDAPKTDEAMTKKHEASADADVVKKDAPAKGDRPDAASEKKVDEIPGFPKMAQTKVEIKKDALGDVELFKAKQPPPAPDAPKESIPEEPFKFTLQPEGHGPAPRPSAKGESVDEWPSGRIPPHGRKDKGATDLPLGLRPGASPWGSTNANKPAAPAQPLGDAVSVDKPPASDKPPKGAVDTSRDKSLDAARDKPLDVARDKQKSKRETLIPGFQPKPHEEKPE